MRATPTPLSSPATSDIDAASGGGIEHEYLWKVLVVGDPACGKTALIKRIVHNVFSQHYKATVGVDFALKVVKWDERTVVRVQMWDIAGQERFGNMTRTYYKEARGAFVVCDVQRLHTFEAVPKWKKDIDDKVLMDAESGTPIPVFLLCNKCDLAPGAGVDVSKEFFAEFCSRYGFAGWFLVSAKDGTNTTEALRALIATVLPLFVRYHGTRDAVLDPHTIMLRDTPPAPPRPEDDPDPDSQLYQPATALGGGRSKGGGCCA